MQDGKLVLATAYALQTDEDFVPTLRKYVPESMVTQYQELLEELR